MSESLSHRATKTVRIVLNSRAFSYYDPAEHGWRVDPGAFTIFVGRSVDQIELHTTISLTPSEVAAGVSH